MCKSKNTNLFTEFKKKNSKVIDMVMIYKAEDQSNLLSSNSKVMQW